MKNKNLIDSLKKTAERIKRETLEVHRTAPETRIASSLSCIEILVALYYGKIINFDSSDPASIHRDRFIISKGHGSIAMYPILADLGFFEKNELLKVCREGSFLAGIPDPVVPGYETVNGSLGHGLGVASGMALGLKKKNESDKAVFVMTGDGELYEGANWEAIMFASHHKLDNLNLIIDNNKLCMLNYCNNIISMGSLSDKLKSFGWETVEIDGHDMGIVYEELIKMKKRKRGCPKAVIANTVKGKGIRKLEESEISHVLSLNSSEIDAVLESEK